jgi:hypothetical protein
MSLSKIILLAAGLALGLSTAGIATKAFAQVSGGTQGSGAQNTPGDMLSDVGEDEAVYYNSNTGKMTKAKVKVSAAMHTKAMAAGAKEVAKGTKPTKTAMVYKHGGKIYMLENKAGSAAGKTMIQEQFQDMFDGAHQY